MSSFIAGSVKFYLPTFEDLQDHYKRLAIWNWTFSGIFMLKGRANPVPSTKTWLKDIYELSSECLSFVHLEVRQHCFTAFQPWERRSSLLTPQQAQVLWTAVNSWPLIIVLLLGLTCLNSPSFSSLMSQTSAIHQHLISLKRGEVSSASSKLLGCVCLDALLQQRETCHPSNVVSK